MRVQGNINTDPVSVVDYRPKPGMAEVRLRENVVQVADNLYEYDEYTAILPSLAGLEQEIKDNLDDWITTLRTLEVNQNASILRDMQDENKAMLDDMAQMIEEIYQMDIEMLGI